MRVCLLLAWLLLVAAWGCSAEPETSTTALRELTEDGIPVLETVVPAWGAGDGWSIDPQPRVQIGVAEGADHDMLAEPRRARFLPDGGIVIPDGASNDVRVFDDAGVFVMRAGRSGSGPCEFAVIGEAWPAADGSLAVPDFGSRGRVTLLGAAGECLGTRSIQMQAYSASDVFGRFPNGDLLLGAWSLSRRRPPAGAAVEWTHATLLRMPWGGTAFELATVPMREGREGLYFASQAAFTSGDERLYSTDGERYSVDVRDGAGTLLWRMRRADLPAPVSEEDIERFQQKARENIRAFGRDDSALEQLAAARFADRYPAYRRLLVDDEGYVWALLYRGLGEEIPFIYPGRPFEEQRFPLPELVQWDVYGPDGRWLGTVPLASERNLADVRGDSVLTEGLDADGVFHVWVHALHRGASAR